MEDKKISAKRVKRATTELISVLLEFMDWVDKKTDSEETEQIPDKEHSVWRVAGDFDFTLPGKEAEFIPELNDIKEIADAFENGETFSVPFVTGEILKLSLATENSFWVGSVCVDPKEGSDNVFDWGYEIRDWNGKPINEIYFSDYIPSEIYLVTEGCPFERIAEDINSFVEGYNS